MDRPDFYNVNLALICKLFERDADGSYKNAVACQNFIESVLNDLEETKNLKNPKLKTVEFTGLSKLSHNKPASQNADLIDTNFNPDALGVSVARQFPYIWDHTYVFDFVCDGVASQLFIVNESVKFMTWWHDISFFSDRLYRVHCQKNDGKKRYLAFLITDNMFSNSSDKAEFTQSNPFHTVSYFNNKNGVKDENFEVHYIYTVNESGREYSNLENWTRALIVKPEEQQDNVSDISEAKKTRVA